MKKKCNFALYHKYSINSLEALWNMTFFFHTQVRILISQKSYSFFWKKKEYIAVSSAKTRFHRKNMKMK